MSRYNELLEVELENLLQYMITIIYQYTLGAHEDMRLEHATPVDTKLTSVVMLINHDVRHTVNRGCVEYSGLVIFIGCVY